MVLYNCGLWAAMIWLTVILLKSSIFEREVEREVEKGVERSGSSVLLRSSCRSWLARIPRPAGSTPFVNQ